MHVVVEYDLTRDEFAQSFQELLARGPFGVAFNIFLLVVYLLGAFVVRTATGSSQGFAAFVSASALLVAWFAMPLITRRLPKEHGGQIGKHRITLSPDGITEETKVGRNHHQWSALSRVLVTKRFIHLFIGDSGVYSIPRRAFESETSIQEFLGVAQRGPQAQLPSN